MTRKLVRALTAIAGVQACAGLVGGLGRTSSLIALAVGCWAGTWRANSRRGAGAATEDESVPSSAPSVASHLGSVFFGVTLALALGERLLAAAYRCREPYDALSYHLVLPLGWLRTGGLGVIPLPFGDSAPAYAPASPELLGATLVAVSGRLHAAQLAQWPFLVLGATAVAEGARQRRAPAWVAAALALLVVALPELYQQTTVAMADVALTGAILAAIVLLSADLGSPDGWLALGLAAGCKSVGVPLAFLVGGVLAARAFVLMRRRGLAATATSSGASRVVDRRVHRATVGVACALGFLAGGGFWLVRAAWIAGNPLFPVALVVGSHVVAGGFYTPADMRAWLYHVPIREVDALVAMLKDQGPGYLVVLVGSWAVQPRRGALALLAVTAASTTLWLLLPYQEPRFFLPVWSLGVLMTGGVPWYAGRRGPALLCVGVGLAWLSPVVPARWLVAALGGAVAVGAAIVAGALSPAGVSTWRARLGMRWLGREAPPLPYVALGLVAWVGLACWGPSPSLALRDDPDDGDDTEGPREALALEAAWGWLDAHGGALPVFYAGTNLVGPLAGPHATRALHTLDAAGDVDRPLHTYPRPVALGQRILPAEPSPDREGADERAWMASLSARAPAWLYVARLGPTLVQATPHDADGFPVERAFADRHPDRLSLAHASAFVRIYRVACAASRAPDPAVTSSQERGLP